MAEKINFYHDVKEHMSPSALANWLGSRSSFIKSYFKNERSAETKAMAFGTKVHALIEGGMLDAQMVFDNNEATLKVEVEKGSGLYFLGKPDSYGLRMEVEGMSSVEFVDYKSGKTNGWDEKLHTDIKMMATAWLVWMQTGKPDEVIGYIEFIETVWDPEAHDMALVPNTETVVMARHYLKAELENFTKAIVKAMKDVNTFYDKWQLASGEFVKNSDIEKALKLRKDIEKMEADLAEVEDRIASQMEFGGEETHKIDGKGTFYFKTSETWEFPDELPVVYGATTITLGEVEPINKGVETAKQNYKLVNEPASTKRTINFRKPPEKKKK